MSYKNASERLALLEANLRPYNNRKHLQNISTLYTDVKLEAAVLILLRWCDTISDWEVLLTVRASHLRSHAGEVAFPGGKRDACDISPIATAVREAQEEVEIPLSSMRLIATLSPFRTRFNFALFPVIAVARADVVPRASVDEVQKCFWLPLQRFLDGRGHSIMALGTFSTHSFHDILRDGENVTTFGITAFICILTAMCVYKKAPTFQFPLHLEQPLHEHTTNHELLTILFENGMQSWLEDRELRGKL